jgi:pre-mRNA-splicing factor ATP-dependent RNA helicase DHX15/PRP43
MMNTVLKLLRLGITGVERFPFVDVPHPDAIAGAIRHLHYLGAVDSVGRITSDGAKMAEFPLDPPLAKTLLVSPTFECSNEILTIVSMLTVPNVWVRPPDQRAEADEAKRRFAVRGGEHLTLLNIYNQFLENREDEQWTTRNFLNPTVLEEAFNVREQLLEIMARQGLDIVSPSNRRMFYQTVRKGLISGFCLQVARRRNFWGDYVTIQEDVAVKLHPSCKDMVPPDWVIYDECILTKEGKKPFLRTVSAIEPEWLLTYGGIYFDLHNFPEGGTRRALMRIRAGDHGRPIRSLSYLRSPILASGSQS